MKAGAQEEKGRAVETVVPCGRLRYSEKRAVSLCIADYCCGGGLLPELLGLVLLGLVLLGLVLLGLLLLPAPMLPELSDMPLSLFLCFLCFLVVVVCVVVV